MSDTDTDIDVDDMDSENSYAEQDDEFDIIVCSQCSIEMDDNEDYEHVADGVNYCIACFELMTEQRQQTKQ